VADGTFERTPSEPGLDQTTPKQGPKPPLLFNVSLRIDPLGHVPNRSYLTLFGSNPKRDIKQKGGFDPLRDMSQTGHLGPLQGPILRETLNKRVVLTPSGTCPQTCHLGPPTVETLNK